MRSLVGGEEDVGRLDEVMAEEVAECVIFFVQGEEGSVGYALESEFSDMTFVEEG